MSSLLLRRLTFLMGVFLVSQTNAMDLRSSLEEQKIISEDSVYLQLEDLSFWDYSDILGTQWLKNNTPKIDTPFLYPIFKDGKMGFLLGTDHTLPLDCFDDSILQLFKSCKSLIIENIEERMTRAILIENKLINENSSYETWWLHDLPSPLKGYLHLLLQHVYSQCPRDYHLWELTPSAAWYMYISAHYLNGMEQGLEDYIVGPKNGLETLKESIAPDVEGVIKTSLTTDDLIDWLNEIQSDGNYLKHVAEAHTSLNYAQGTLCVSQEDLDETNNPNSEMSYRNSNWMKRWDTYFANFDRPLFAVGALHLVGEYGLFSLLEKRGYTIGQRILASDVHKFL